MNPVLKRALALVLLLASACGGTVCSTGFRHATICTSCGPAGGCMATESQCVKHCTSSGECPAGTGCVDGVCQSGPCI